MYHENVSTLAALNDHSIHCLHVEKAQLYVLMTKPVLPDACKFCTNVCMLCFQLLRQAGLPVNLSTHDCHFWCDGIP